MRSNTACLVLCAALIAPSLLGGCAGETDEVLYAEGTLTVSRDDRVATLRTRAAYGYVVGSAGMVYLASGTDSSCDDLESFLASSDRFDPSGVFAPGSCNLLYKFRLPEEGATELSYTEDDQGADSEWSIDCAPEGGDWAFERRSEGTGYYYQDEEGNNLRWSGGPLAYTVDLTGIESRAAPTMSFSMTDFSGQYNEVGAVKEESTGSFSGSDIALTACDNFPQFPQFPRQ